MANGVSATKDRWNFVFQNLKWSQWTLQRVSDEI